MLPCVNDDRVAWAEEGFEDVELERGELEDRKGQTVEKVVEDFDEEVEKPQGDDVCDDEELSGEELEDWEEIIDEPVGMLDEEDSVKLETIDETVESSWNELDESEDDTCELLDILDEDNNVELDTIDENVDESTLLVPEDDCVEPMLLELET